MQLVGQYADDPVQEPPRTIVTTNPKLVCLACELPVFLRVAWWVGKVCNQRTGEWPKPLEE